MTISKRRSDLDDDRLRTAIAYGFGSTHEETAEFSSKSVSTVRRWQDDPEIKRISEAVAACKSIYESKRLKNAVSDAVVSAEERIKRIFDRATRLTERAVEKVEAMGDQATLAELMEMHKQITVWASKYAASEAPKRMQFEGNVEHTYKAVISLEEARNIAANDFLFEKTSGPKLIAGDSGVIDLTPNA